MTLREVKTPGGSVVEMQSTVVDRMALSPGCRCLHRARSGGGGATTAVPALLGPDPQLVGL